MVLIGETLTGRFCEVTVSADAGVGGRDLLAEVILVLICLETRSVKPLKERLNEGLSTIFSGREGTAGKESRGPRRTASASAEILRTGPASGLDRFQESRLTRMVS
jgi:hypothetical protein